MLKNAKKRTKTKALTRFGVLAKARKYADRIVLMTGTPAPKGLQNLWGLAYVADLGERLGTSKHWFEQRWFMKDHMGWKLEPREGAERQITKRLSDIVFALDPRDYAELPPMVMNTVKVNLPKRVLARYREFEKTLVSEVYDVEAVSKGVLTNKLLQFSNGSMYQEDGADVWIHDEKLEALENIVDEANGAPVIVAYSFKFDLDRIRSRFKKAVVLNEDSTAVARWNRGEIELLLAHPASAGHGLNLQSGGNISVWYGLTHDLELYQQFNKRLHRPGQTKTVFNHHIIAAQTYDEDILPLLARKDATQRSVMDSLIVRLAR
jgi:SNF2 family DNA or RNA helicase